MQETGGNSPIIGEHSFSYISKNEFNSIFKQVRRERRKRHEEKVWERFLMKKKEIHASSQRIKIGDAAVQYDINLVNQENLEIDSSPNPKNNGCLPNAHKVDAFQFHQGQNKSPELVPSPEPVSHQFLSAERQECVCCHLGQQMPSPAHCGSINEFQIYPQSPDNKLFEITNFDQEFKRVEELRDKIVFALKSIEAALNQDSKSLDEEEMQRNKLRMAEFASRFKRNYHYQITRQVNEIKKLSSSESWKKTNVPTAVKKFKSSHQVAVQALQAVEKHLRTTNDGGSHLWLQEFLTSVCEMERLFMSVFYSDDDGEEMAFKAATSNIIQRLDSMGHKHKREPEAKKKKQKRASKRNEVKDNLWMYRSHNDWKSKASELARLRLAKLNKKKAEPYEQATEQHDDKSTVAATVPENLPDVRMEVKQREGASLRKHIRSIKEDQVRTMMEIVPDATDSDHEEDDLDFHRKELLKAADVRAKSERPPAGGGQEAVPSAPANPAVQNANAGPTNVGFICLKRDEDESTPSKCGVSASVTEAYKYSKPQVKLATQYRRALQSYQRKQKWYNPNIISSIENMTDKIYEELIGTVTSEINIDHIISNLIELEVRN